MPTSTATRSRRRWPRSKTAQDKFPRLAGGSRRTRHVPGPEGRADRRRARRFLEWRRRDVSPRNRGWDGHRIPGVVWCSRQRPGGKAKPRPKPVAPVKPKPAPAPVARRPAAVAQPAARAASVTANPLAHERATPKPAPAAPSAAPAATGPRDVRYGRPRRRRPRFRAAPSRARCLSATPTRHTSRTHGPISLEHFKARLGLALQARHIDLSRADMVEALDAFDVARSITFHPMSTSWEFHWIRVE